VEEKVVLRSHAEVSKIIPDEVATESELCD
jgi:hypothetical protein